jgi:ABC-2 type transport system ATP-binding protein
MGLEEGAAEAIVDRVAELPGVRAAAHADGQLKVETERLQQALMGTLDVTNQLDLRVTSLEIWEPNLESVFLNLTGKKLRQ